MLVDAHNHAQDSRLDRIRLQLAADWEQIGLDFAVANGTREDDWPAVQKWTQTCSLLVPSYGLHPWYVEQASRGWKSHLLQRLEKGSAGVGEIGLDHWKSGLNPSCQEEAFLWQWDIAVRMNLPASVHCLRAFDRLRDLLRDRPAPSCGWLLHAYSGPVEYIEPFARMGAYFSFSGNFLWPNKRKRVELFRHVPRDRLLIETDAPDMPIPEIYRSFDAGEGNTHPANIRSVLVGLATAWQEPPGELEELTRVNAHRLFGSLLRKASMP